ncbi:MAG TPA: hypothetical protein VFT72_00560 [Opitutaceae bacterium]|nr:hypothetical protein [Opitutaceae bacterium]
MNRKYLLSVALVPPFVLLVPLAAMLLRVEGWAWSASDFIVAWMLMTGIGLAYVLVTRNASTTAYRVAAGIALGTAFLLIWVNGAVGLIGSENNPANLMYGGVLVIGAVGAAMARFAALGMARTLFAAAFVQFAVPVVSLMLRPGDFSPGVIPVFALNFLFVLLFIGSALLFRHAAHTQAENSRG